MFCYQRELQKAWILWNGKARTKKARCAFCLLSVNSQRFLNTWGVTWWGAVGGYHFKWRQFSDFLKCFQIKVIGNTPRSVSGLVHSELAGPEGAVSAQPYPPFPQVDNSEDPLWHSLSAFGIFAVWTDTHTSISHGCAGACLQVVLICGMGVRNSTWSEAVSVKPQVCALYLVI